VVKKLQYLQATEAQLSDALERYESKAIAEFADFQQFVQREKPALGLARSREPQESPTASPSSPQVTAHVGTVTLPPCKHLFELYVAC
jgi:hypothetical protein